MYDWKTAEYQRYVEAHNDMVEKQTHGQVVTVQEQLTVQIAFTEAQVAATEL